MGGKLVYSTSVAGGGDQRKAGRESGHGGGGGKSGGGPCKMRLESKGRGGKSVTILFNLPFTDDEARQILRTLQGRLGTGGTFKDGRIEFQGDVRDKVEAYFVGEGLKLVRAGG